MSDFPVVLPKHSKRVSDDELALVLNNAKFFKDSIDNTEAYIEKYKISREFALPNSLWEIPSFFDDVNAERMLKAKKAEIQNLRLRMGFLPVLTS